MKIAVTYENGQIFQHFGHTEQFKIYTVENGTIRTLTNHAGGIQGGITNGMPVIFRCVIRPTPSIGREQRTVSLKTGENAVLAVKGRHDPCILPRAVPVIEAMAAIAVMELWKERAACLS